LPTGGTEDVQPEATLPPPAREDVPIKPAAPSPPPLPTEPKAEAKPEKSPSIPLISELPFDVREKLGRLQINVHSYSENPAERLVFINMQNLKVGDRIGENGPILKEITPKGVIIDYGDGQARVLVSP
jgi:general secretion pathway protein B